MELRVLGPVEVHAAGREWPAGPPQQRAVLAALAVDAGRSVPVGVLVDRVWGDSPPVRAQRTLHTHLSRIRRLLEQAGGDAHRALVVRRAGGYLLDVDPTVVDLHRFRHLLDRARDPAEPDTRRVVLLREALALAQRPALAGLGGPWVARMREWWCQYHLDAVVAWARAELRVGNPTAVIATVTDLLDEFPFVEPLAEVLMRALHASGRKADALDRYAATRRRLVEELGVDPGTELRQAYQAILRGDTDQAAPRPASPAAAALTVPAQLPANPVGFVGRPSELNQLDSLLEGAAHQAVVSVVTGMAGVGKTALALYWAHRVAHRFPDGQLYVDLRGYGPGSAAMPPADAVRAVLDAFDVPDWRIPATLHARVGRYRSLLAGRRILVVLDNARDADQVRPLLPATSGCLAVVTSRNQLSGLVAAEGARPLTLDLPTLDECRQLLSGRLGIGRATAEPGAIDDIVAACARLPLALVIVAARAVTHPVYSLAVLAKELAEAHGGLAAFTGPDPATDVRSAFGWSYRTLTPEAARLFQLLGTHPGPDISVPAAARLAATPLARTRQLLAELRRAHLIIGPASGRYSLHDLLRAYAADLRVAAASSMRR